jgi:hypothetical protein
MVIKFMFAFAFEAIVLRASRNHTDIWPNGQILATGSNGKCRC